MKVGDLVMWRYPHDRRKPEFGVIINVDNHRREIKVVDLCQERSGDADWWSEGDWEVTSEIDLTSTATPITLHE